MRKILTGIFCLISAVCFSAPVKSNLGAKSIEYIEGETAIPTAADYVQDGLVAMWDGIENAGYGVHDPNAAEPCELVSGQLETNMARYVTMQDDNIETIVGAVARSYNTELTTRLAECVANGYARIECLTHNEIPASGVYGNSVFILGGSFGYQNHTGLGGCSMLSSGWVSAQDISIKDRRCVNLAIEIDSESGTIQYFVGDTASPIKAITLPSTLDIGFRMTILYMTRIFSFRVYNRPMTAEEISHNKAIDKIRFPEQ